MNSGSDACNSPSKILIIYFSKLMLRLVRFSISCTPAIFLHTTMQMASLHGLLFIPSEKCEMDDLLFWKT
jgi:hypothetical protein